uniref:Semaphorin 4C n=1 Tax=Crocodylus porosus TaxID=8502 RepID=A0A7M4DVL2_CROPO
MPRPSRLGLGIGGHQGRSSMAAGLGGALLLLALLELELGGTESSPWDLVPRKTVPYGELPAGARRFGGAGMSHFLTLTLDEAEGLLYAGAREAVFALSTAALNLQATILWEAPEDKKLECIQKGKNNQTDCFNYVRLVQPLNASHLYACGTGAFQPKCAYIDRATFSLDPQAFEDGKGKCPYDPTKGHTGLVVDGELYSATLNNFLGTEPVIQRNLGPRYSMKTEFLPSWLNEPHFVGSAFVPESEGSASGDDDKVYFFFSERAVEYDCDTPHVVARVARVCKGDIGGARTLQKKWTSFLKARLVCALPEQQLHFDRLQALATLPSPTWSHTAFFGLFHARWGDVVVSAVCQYDLKTVQQAFDGPYKEYQEQAQKWGRYSDPVPSPRPGACITAWHRDNGFASSLELPDNTLNFAKKHPLMDEPVLPHGGHPLLLKKGANLTHLAVDRAHGLDGQLYNVLFLGTDDGWLLKAVSMPTHAHLVEELQIFEQGQPVESLVLAPQKKLVFAGSRSQVVRLPLADCNKYLSCPDCLLARDPHCAWSRNTSRCVHADGRNRALLIQDVAAANTALCSMPRAVNPAPAAPKNVTVAAGTDLVLPCRLASNLARARWTFNGRELPAERVPELADARVRALLLLGAGPQHAGTYQCFSEEQGALLATEAYAVAVLPGLATTLEARAPLEGLGLVWMVAVALGAVCAVLLVVVLSLRRRLREELDKGAKAAERTLVYPIELPKEPASPRFAPSTTSDSDEKLWDPGSYYYSDGSLKIVPGHAACPNGGPAPSPGIPGQPLPSPPPRAPLGGLRGSASNGYIRLQLGAEARPERGELAEELRRKLKQRQALPDSNPEESSV